MQTIRHAGVDVLYNVSKLPRDPGDARFMFRVKFGGNVARHVDVPLEDYAWPKGGSAAECTKHRMAMPAKALQVALGVVFAGATSTLPVAAPAPVKPEKSEKHDDKDKK
jgi:hypothetical protein